MIKVGDIFRATDRLGLVSTWKLIEQDDEKKFRLEAVGETLKRCEADYELLNRIKPESTTWEDCCTIKVEGTWFDLRKIEVLKDKMEL